MSTTVDLTRDTVVNSTIDPTPDSTVDRAGDSTVAMSTQLLTELLSVSAATVTSVSEHDMSSAGRVALETTISALEAELGAFIASDGSIALSIGFLSDNVPMAEVSEVLARHQTTLTVPGTDMTYHAAVVPLEGCRPGHLLVARTRDFDPDELFLLRGAALVLDLTFGASEATYDPLTGLACRAAFRHRLAKELATVPNLSTVALLYIDLDNFKSINDSYGHAEGDRLLTWFAGRLRRSVRPGDVSARLGGDEFAVLMRDVGPEQANAVVSRIVDNLRAPFVVADGRTVAVGASIGIAITTNPNNTGIDDLIRQADQAMYQAKKGRTNNQHTM